MSRSYQEGDDSASMDCDSGRASETSTRDATQRLQKKRVKRDCPLSYVTLERKGRRTLNGATEGGDTLKMMLMVASSTAALRGSGGSFSDEGELMEIPRPATPDHDPPSPAHAEREIQDVLDCLRMVGFIQASLCNGQWPCVLVYLGN
jgi:hypothetical protein